MTRASLPLRRVACAALILVAGCAGSPPQAPSTPRESAESFQRVVVESPGRADHGKLIAYVGEKVVAIEQREHNVIHVYDLAFKTLGFYLVNGATYRVSTDRAGVSHEEFLGNHDPRTSIERICGAEGPFLFLSGL